MHKIGLNKVRFNSITLAMCLVLASSCAFAGPEAGSNMIPSGIGNFDAGVIDQTNLRQIKDYEQRVRDDREEEHLEEKIEMNKEMKDKMDNLPNKEVSFVLNSIHITGNTEYTEEQLMNLVCQKVGSVVTINDLIGMANSITEYYQRNGYISTTAYLPPQKVEDGNVEIVVLEGK